MKIGAVCERPINRSIVEFTAASIDEVDGCDGIHDEVMIMAVFTPILAGAMFSPSASSHCRSTPICSTKDFTTFLPFMEFRMNIATNAKRSFLNTLLGGGDALSTGDLPSEGGIVNKLLRLQFRLAGRG